MTLTYLEDPLISSSLTCVRIDKAASTSNARSSATKSDSVDTAVLLALLLSFASCAILLIVPTEILNSSGISGESFRNALALIESFVIAAAAVV